MTRKRTLHDLRTRARQQQSSWWSRLQDELIFIYLSGKRGINANFLVPTGYTGRANNALAAPDTNHILYGNNATAYNNIDSADTFDLRLIDRSRDADLSVRDHLGERRQDRGGGDHRRADPYPTLRPTDRLRDPVGQRISEAGAEPRAHLDSVHLHRAWLDLP